MAWGRVSLLALCVAKLAWAGPDVPPPSPPPPPPEVPTVAPPPPLAPPLDAPVVPAPPAPASPPPSATLQNPNPFQLQAEGRYPERGESVAGTVLVGAPLTWIAATVPAAAAGALGFGLALAASHETLSGPSGGQGSLAVGFGIGAPVGILITYFMLPALAKSFGDDAKYVGSTEAARDEGWRRGRWGVIAMYAGLLAAATGGYLASNTDFQSTGQTVAALGWVVSGVSYLAAWILETSGVLEGYEASRRPRFVSSSP